MLKIAMIKLKKKHNTQKSLAVKSCTITYMLEAKKYSCCGKCVNVKFMLTIAILSDESFKSNIREYSFHFIRTLVSLRG